MNTSQPLCRVLLTGDNVGFGQEGGLEPHYRHVRQALSQGDIVCGNLEWPLCGDDSYPAHRGRPLGHMLPKDAVALREAGFDVMSMANNHMMDFGPKAMLETIRMLDEQGIAHCGAGANAAAAWLPVYLSAKGIKVAFFAWTAVFILPSHPTPPSASDPQMAMVRVRTSYEIPHKLFEQPGTPPTIVTTVDPEDAQAVQEAIRRAKVAADVVVVSWHWGVSGGYRKRVPYQLEMGRKCIDAGAALVIGHHPHVLQGVERYKDGLICYSLGNFVFWRATTPGPFHDPLSVMADCVITSEGICTANLQPIMRNAKGHPELVGGDSGRGAFEQMARDSESGLLSYDQSVIRVDLASASRA